MLLRMSEENMEKETMNTINDQKKTTSKYGNGFK